jgi:uncharacterized membrane protein YphA (DoxX/SURF4 family)
MTYILWVIQILLALLFIFAGGSKLFMSIELMQEYARQAGQTPLPGFLLRFIGVAELLGGLGLVLPGLLRIRPGLTPLAAAGLLIIMIGAVVITISSGMIGAAIFPLIVALLLLFVLYGRWKLAPIAKR